MKLYLKYLKARLLSWGVFVTRMKYAGPNNVNFFPLEMCQANRTGKMPAHCHISREVIINHQRTVPGLLSLARRYKLWGGALFYIQWEWQGSLNGTNMFARNKRDHSSGWI
ncbi:hypothetical protein CEXT_436231 [Caerostris extrusa]|uniref:Beta-galactosidase n=1 Tax=Caerostris extrusa TaxID=172846 RepID=A0AAV4N023_CAEEX|nr:hypothetical protein CEXT_436231 [Caerostris extrusa]